FAAPISGNVGTILRWSGSAWTSIGGATVMGSFLVPAVFALTSYNGSLIAGGVFATVNGVAAPDIAQWNGTAWSALAMGIRGPSAAVYACVPFGSSLLAGGSFTQAGAISANSIAAWDGTSWTTLGAGVTNGTGRGEVAALAVDGATAVASGS